MKKQFIFLASLCLTAVLFLSTSAYAQWDATTFAPHIFNTNTGNVGVGPFDSAPDANFHLRSQGIADFQISRPLTGNGVVGRFRIINETNGNMLNMVLRTTAGRDLVIQSAFNAATNEWYEFSRLDFSNALYEFRPGIGQIQFQNSADVLFVNSGAVGIGISEADAETKLEGIALGVNGTIKATELIVELYENWPDFVFADDYELMSLYEVENYIKQNRHLPNVPSEAQVLEGGVNVGEMTSILLQKVEELTLHIIELNKRIEELEK